MKESKLGKITKRIPNENLDVMIERVTTALGGSVDWRRTRRMTTGMTQYDV
jgi:hypothetical protein